MDGSQVGDDHPAAQTLHAAQELMDQKRFDEAAWLALEVTESHPELWLGHYLYAECMMRSVPPKSFEALAAAKEATRLDPDNPSARVLLGMCLEETGSAAEGRDAYRAALRLDPAHGNALNNLAVHHINWWRLGTAAREIGRIRAEESEHPAYSWNLARCANRMAVRLLLLLFASACVLDVLLDVDRPSYARPIVCSVALVVVGLVALDSWRSLPARLRSRPRDVLSPFWWGWVALVLALPTLVWVVLLGFFW
ncbi:hypothetical protein ASG90_06965 [Nocardioides sp. Soil797]|nr:hypothetical protein ASG90_06965 [Nocardioides sp. Soil797]